MTRRTCSFCGARVARSAERCRECGGEPDLEPLEPIGGETFHLSTERPPHDARRWWRRVALAATVAVVWVTAALMTGGPDEDETGGDADRTSTTQADAARTTTSIGPTSTTAEVISGGPLLGEPSGLHLVEVSDLTSLIVDLDTGAITRPSQRVLGVADRRLVVSGQGVVALWPPPYDGSSATTIATIPADRSVEQAWTVDADGSRVWLVLSVPSGHAPPTPMSAILVDLAGRTLARVDLPDGFAPYGALDRGLVVAGPGGIYVIHSDGDATRISTGDLLDVAANLVLTQTCDERLRCGVETVDGRGRRVESGAFGGAVAGPGHRTASIVQADPNDTTGRVVLDGVPVFDAVASGTVSALAWSPNGRWLAILATDGIHIVDTRGGRAPVAVDAALSASNGFSLFAFT